MHEPEKMSFKDWVYLIFLILIIILFIWTFVYYVRHPGSFSQVLEEQRQENEQARLTHQEKTANKIETINLTGIELDSNLTGVFGLGSGVLDNEYYYIAYQILENGGKKLFKMKAEYTTIFETLEENEQAYAEVELVYFLGGYITEEIRLYVPKNTIQKEYDFSLAK